jgi:hypothetical protein
MTGPEENPVPTHTPTPQRPRWLPSPAMAVAMVALFVSLSGGAYAVSVARNSVGHQQIRTGAVRSSEIENGSIGTRDISRGGRRSLRGAGGPQGPVGPAGPTGVTYHAAFSSNGGKIRGNTTSSEPIPGGGQGGIAGFDRDVSGCEAVATLTTSAGDVDVPPGQITVRPNGARVEVRTYDSDGTPRGLPFNLIVVC